MTSRATSLAALAAGAVLAAAPSAASAAAPPVRCPLLSQPTAAAHPIPGTGLVARDPYGGLLTRNRLFFDFSVQGSKADLAQVAKATWSMDGRVVREDPKPPFQWKGVSGSSKRMPAGDHTITVAVVLRDGSTHATGFPLTATDCQRVDFSAEIAQRRGPARFTADAAFESAAGEPLRALELEATRNVAVRAPRRGARAGTLTVDRRSYRLSARGRTLLRRDGITVTLHPGARRFLRVSGLPSGTQHVGIRLASGIAALRSPKRTFFVTAQFAGAAGGRAQAESGGRYA